MGVLLFIVVVLYVIFDSPGFGWGEMIFGMLLVAALGAK